MKNTDEISPRTLYRRLAEGEEVFLLDVREPDEFEFVRLNALNIPLGELAARMRELDPAREIIVYCHHGTRSRYAVDQLRRAGFTRVVNLTGGIDACARTVDPSLRRY